MAEQVRVTADDDLEEMRLKIIEAASKIYEKKGRDATVEEIAHAAGVSVPVTYQFVKKASDIMLVIMEHLQSRFTSEMTALNNHDNTANERLMNAVEAYFKVVEEKSHKVLLVYRASRKLDKAGRQRIMQLEQEAVTIFRDILDAGVASGEFKVMDTGLAAYDIVVMGHLWSLKGWHFKRLGMPFQNFLLRQKALITAMVKA